MVRNIQKTIYRKSKREKKKAHDSIKATAAFCFCYCIQIEFKLAKMRKRTSDAESPAAQSNMVKKKSYEKERDPNFPFLRQLLLLNRNSVNLLVKSGTQVGKAEKEKCLFK